MVYLGATKWIHSLVGVGFLAVRAQWYHLKQSRIGFEYFDPSGHLILISKLENLLLDLQGLRYIKSNSVPRNQWIEWWVEWVRIEAHLPTPSRWCRWKNQPSSGTGWSWGRGWHPRKWNPTVTFAPIERVSICILIMKSSTSFIYCFAGALGSWVCDNLGRLFGWGACIVAD